MYMDSTVEHLEDFAKEGKLIKNCSIQWVKSSLCARTFPIFPTNHTVNAVSQIFIITDEILAI